MSKLNHVPRSIVCLLAVCFAGIGIHSADAAEPNQELSKSAGNGDHTVGPDYRLDPDLTDRGNPKGQSFEFALPLAESKIFRGDDPSLSPSKPVRIVFDDLAPVRIAAPANFTGYAFEDGGATLNWKDISGNETGFEICILCVK